MINLHEALQTSALKNDFKDTPRSIRLGPFAEQAEEICRVNGSTLACFLRECIENLVKEYSDVGRSTEN